MRLSIRAIGRQKRGAESQLVEDYLKRAKAAGRPSGFADVALFEADAARAQTKDLRQAQEGDFLMAGVEKGAKCVLLDERGKDLSSAAFAETLSRWRDDGVPETVFLLGGPDGAGEAVKARSDMMLAFGRATWPHLLARALLSEQIYRAMTILSGHPYHRA